MELHASKRRRLNDLSTVQSNHLLPDEPFSADLPAHNHAVLPQNTPTLSTKTGSISSKQSPRAQDRQAKSASDSSIFQLQIQELLAKVRPSHGSRMEKVEIALRKLKRVIELIPNREPTTVLRAEKNLRESHDIKIPFPEPRPGFEVKYLLAYAKPDNINIVGSYARKSAVPVHGRLMIDLAVTMPSNVFQHKDYLNYRYFYKRAYYIACIAAGIQGGQDCNYNVAFTYQNGNHLQPILIINPILDGGEDDFSKSKCQIRIILAASGCLFPIAKTLPHKNCIRSKVLHTQPAEILPAATPLYNATMRSECSTLSYLELLHKTSTYFDSFRDACVLGSVWLQQRGFGTDFADGGFGQFEWACVTAILLRGGGSKEKPALSKGYDYCQLFKATLQYLAITDLTQNPLIVYSDHVDFGAYKCPLFFDGKRGLNVLFKMATWSYNTLRHEARLTIKTLNDPLGDKFNPSFITRTNEFFYRFDYIFSIHIPSTWKPSAERFDSSDRVTRFCQELFDVLTTGLGDRIKLIHPQMTKDPMWPISTPNPSLNRRPVVVVGILLNVEQHGRTVDHGPLAEDKNAAAAFRAFWGEKAELRRFKDGSIHESLVWSTADSSYNVLDRIVAHILRRHMGQETAEGINFVGNAFEHLLPESKVSNPLAIYQPLTKAFETLAKEIRSIEGLPLQIRQISTTSPQLRYTSYDTPNPSSFGYCAQPVSVYVQFEGSTRWPDDLVAIQRTKIALLLKIGELLEESTSGLILRLGLENEQQEFLNQAFVDLIHPTGAIFRLRIHHERELSILEHLLRDKLNDFEKRAEIAFAISTHKRDFVQRPLHTEAVRTLSTRFPLLSPSIRIMKKWRDSHLLSLHISDELIEILTIRTFVQPDPWQTPGSVMTGFLRTLAFISKWDWQSEPLIVDFGHEISTKDVEGISLRFAAWRKIDPGMNRFVVFAASNLDTDGISWTEQGPSKVVAARFTSLARAACKLMKEQALNMEPSALFAMSTAEYDFIIHLNPKFISNNLGQDRQRAYFKNLQIQPSWNTSLVGIDPIRLYLEEISRLYGKNVLFFHGVNDGSCIGGLWSPQTGSRDWKVNMTYSTLPTLRPGDADGKIVINKISTLHDIARLGGDMVSRIEERR